MTPRSRPRIALISLGAASVGLALAVSGLAAVGGSDATAERVTPIQFAPVGALRESKPISAAVTLNEVMTRMDRAPLAAASVGSPPQDVQRLDPARAELPWFYASVHVPSVREGLDIKPLWTADLVEGVVAERAGRAANIREDFGGSSFRAILPGGRSIDVGGGLGDVARGQIFSTEQNAIVKSEVASLLHNAGLTPVSIDVLRPLGPVPAVVAASNDPETAARQLMRIIKAVFGNPPRYEGYYLELQDLAGNPIARVSTSFRTGAGRSWRAPGWEDRVAVKTLGKPELNFP